MVSFEDGSKRPKGLEFAQNQLEKHGWSKGKGLGKDESGRADAVKVGVKNDTLGVGYDVGKEFTYHWWDHMFNKAASNIVVEQSESGIQVSKKDASAVDLSRPKKFWRVKGQQLYYGRFVKATNDCDKPVTDNHEVTTKFSDEQLLKACGGRTAHKSARHGHKLSGKLKRIAEQEDTSEPAINHTDTVLNQDNVEQVAVCYEKSKKKKKKRRKENVISLGEDESNTSLHTITPYENVVDNIPLACNGGFNGHSTAENCLMTEAVVDRRDGGEGLKRKRKKKKKKTKETVSKTEKDVNESWKSNDFDLKSREEKDVDKSKKLKKVDKSAKRKTKRLKHEKNKILYTSLSL